MATFNITSDANYHDVAYQYRSENDTYVVASGKTLTFDCDTRYGPNTSNAAGLFGLIDLSAGGSGKVATSGVRLIHFTGGAGSVPLPGTTITNNGATGKLIGVWSAINTAPLSTYSGMPSSGFIKVRQVTGAYASGSLTGISATSSGVDVAGWIELCASRQASTHWNLGPNTTFEMLGSWFYCLASPTGRAVATVSGAANQTIYYPASVPYTAIHAIWVETGPNTNVWDKFVVSSYIYAYHRGGYSTNGDGVLVLSSTLVTSRVGARIRIPNILCGVGNISGQSVSNWAWTTYGDTCQQVSAPGVWPGGAIKKMSFNLVSSAPNTVVQTSLLGSFTLESTTSVGTYVLGSVLDSFLVNDSVADVGNYAVVAQRRIVADYALTGVNVTNSRFNSQFNSAYANLGIIDVSTPSLSVSGCTFDGYAMHGGGSGYGAYAVSTNRSPKSVLTNNKVAGPVTLCAPKSSGLTVNGVGVSGSAAIIAPEVGPNFKISNITSNVSNYLIAVTSGVSDGLEVRNIGTVSAPVSAGPYFDYFLKFSTYAAGMSTVCASPRVQRVYWSAGALDCGYASNMLLESAGTPGVATVLTVNGPDAVIRAWYGARATGASPGLHWFDRFASSTAGEICVKMSSTTALSASQVTVTSGTPTFDGLGTLTLKAFDQVEFEMPYWVQGHTVLTDFAVTATGTYTITKSYKIDTGSGWSASWKSATAGNLAAEAINPATGFKLKLRLFGATGTAYITYAAFATTSTAVAQAAINYPLDPVTITVNNLVANTHVIVRKNNSSGDILFSGAESDGQISFSADYSGVIHVDARKADQAPFYQPWVTLATISGDVVLTALQIPD